MDEDGLINSMFASMSDKDMHEAVERMMRDGACFTRSTFNTKTGKAEYEFIDQPDFRGNA